ncbi:hypothetical protein [Hwangdonia lutea]|uniref:Uncharacterized protein n=1 Tax=Hwangdonia lutea TaxID=3075823 RepID=A0AA97HPU3_9FLAO|nr:hypothetical protein [Hwangdonia sp. SCSIO 19198]WOD43007.1 hypothetical protein RNZ46_13520 [Hwangdonia sp. SCSIO 19198]
MFSDYLIPTSMLLTITISISALVAINFLLLKFSSNKTIRTSKVNKKPIVLKPTIALKQDAEKLAPTGS